MDNLEKLQQRIQELEIEVARLKKQERVDIPDHELVGDGDEY